MSRKQRARPDFLAPRQRRAGNAGRGSSCGIRSRGCGAPLRMPKAHPPSSRMHPPTLSPLPARLKSDTRLKFLPSMFPPFPARHLLPLQVVREGKGFPVGTFLQKAQTTCASSFDLAARPAPPAATLWSNTLARRALKLQLDASRDALQGRYAPISEKGALSLVATPLISPRGPLLFLLFAKK